MDRDHADVRVAPPIIMLAFLAAMWLLDRAFPLGTTSQIPRALGIGLVLGAIALALWAVTELLRARTTFEPHGTVTALVTSGPYRYSRNPIYLAYGLMLMGLPLALGTFWGVILTPLLIISLDRWVIRHEEAYLREKFGGTYAEYESRVRRWL